MSLLMLPPEARVFFLEELGALPLERVTVVASVVATQTASPVPYESSGSVNAVGESTVSVEPVTYGSLTVSGSASATVTARTYTPTVTPTAMAAASAPLVGATSYPALFETAAGELDILPLEDSGGHADVLASAQVTVSAQVISMGAVSTSGTATVTAVSTTFSGQISANVVASVQLVTYEQGSVSATGEATVTATGAKVNYGAISVEGSASTTVAPFLTRFAATNQAAAASQTVIAYAYVVSAAETTATATVLVAGLRLNPGDAAAVPVGSGLRVVLLTTDMVPVLYVPGPSTTPLPIPPETNFYDPDDNRVAVLSSV